MKHKKTLFYWYSSNGNKGEGGVTNLYSNFILKDIENLESQEQ